MTSGPSCRLSAHGHRDLEPHHSLDGFIADHDDKVCPLFDWMELAGDRVVSVAGGTVAREALYARLMDELWVNMVPVIFGSGIPWLSGGDHPPILLDDPEVVQGDRVTHLRYPRQRPVIAAASRRSAAQRSISTRSMSDSALRWLTASAARSRFAGPVTGSS